MGASWASIELRTFFLLLTSEVEPNKKLFTKFELRPRQNFMLLNTVTLHISQNRPYLLKFPNLFTIFFLHFPSKLNILFNEITFCHKHSKLSSQKNQNPHGLEQNSQLLNIIVCSNTTSNVRQDVKFSIQFISRVKISVHIDVLLLQEILLRRILQPQGKIMSSNNHSKR